MTIVAVRSRILEAAAEELRPQGLGGIGIPALMKRAGLTHGAFYAHFPNRDALVPWRGGGPTAPAPLHPRKPFPVPSDGALRLVSPMVGAGVLARLVDDPVLARRLMDAAVPPVDSIQAGG
jgi:hypothetical protein